MSKILQLKISLEGIQPEIWRRFLVEDSINFERLHTIIQKVMGWENYHMFEFCIGNETITCEEGGFNPVDGVFRDLHKSPEFAELLGKMHTSKGHAVMDIDKINEILEKINQDKPKDRFSLKTKINQLITSEAQNFTYIYDFGDNWEHTLVVEKIGEEDKTKKYPLCLAGERACPPEDCGSVGGYYELMKIRKNKKHPRYEEMVIEWLGEDYNPELFVADWVNARLQGRRPAPIWVLTEKAGNEKTRKETIRKAGRNEPCPCGSGKKYKKCCLGK